MAQGCNRLELQPSVFKIIIQIIIENLTTVIVTQSNWTPLSAVAGFVKEKALTALLSSAHRPLAELGAVSLARDVRLFVSSFLPLNIRCC